MRLIQGKVHMKNSIQQLESVGPRSLGVSLLTASFVGMVFTIQASPPWTPISQWVLRLHQTAGAKFHQLPSFLIVAKIAFSEGNSVQLQLILTNIFCCAVCAWICKIGINPVGRRCAGLGFGKGALASGHCHHSGWSCRQCLCSWAWNNAGQSPSPSRNSQASSHLFLSTIACQAGLPRVTSTPNCRRGVLLDYALFRPRIW